MRQRRLEDLWSASRSAHKDCSLMAEVIEESKDICHTTGKAVPSDWRCRSPSRPPVKSNNLRVRGQFRHAMLTKGCTPSPTPQATMHKKQRYPSPIDLVVHAKAINNRMRHAVLPPSSLN